MTAMANVGTAFFSAATISSMGSFTLQNNTWGEIAASTANFALGLLGTHMLVPEPANKDNLLADFFKVQVLVGGALSALNYFDITPEALQEVQVSINEFVAPLGQGLAAFAIGMAASLQLSDTIGSFGLIILPNCVNQIIEWTKSSEFFQGPDPCPTSYADWASSHIFVIFSIWTTFRWAGNND